MARMPDNVATFELGHYEALVIARALAYYVDEAPSTTEIERETANDFAHILGTGECVYTLTKKQVH